MVLVYFLLGAIAVAVYIYLQQTQGRAKSNSPKASRQHRSSRRAQPEERVKKPPNELQQPDLFAQFLSTEGSRENSPCNSKKNYVPPASQEAPEVAPPQIPSQSSTPETDVMTALLITDESTPGVVTAELLSNSESKDVQTANLLSDSGETRDVKTANLIGDDMILSAPTMTPNSENGGEKKKKRKSKKKKSAERKRSTGGSKKNSKKNKKKKKSKDVERKVA